MARARNIKPGFFKNEDLAELKIETRLLFIGLWTLADREGRLEDRPKRIKGELFPFDSFEVDSMLSELQSSSFLVRYAVNGGRYIQITNFVKHQDPHYRERASEIPPPPGVSNSIVATNVTRTQRQRIYERDQFKCRRCGSTDNLSIDHVLPISKGGDSSDSNLQVLCFPCNHRKGRNVESNSGEGSPNMDEAPTGQPESSPGPAPSDCLIPDSLIPDCSKPPSSDQPSGSKPRRKKPSTPPPAVFDVTEDMAQWAVDQGLPEERIEPETRKFLDHHRAKGTLFADWNAAWRTWIRNAVEFSRR